MTHKQETTMNNTINSNMHVCARTSRAKAVCDASTFEEVKCS